MIVFWLATAGFVLSAYALYVDIARPKNPLCNLHDRISCTKAFYSKYGRLLGVPNSAFGVVFYPCLAVLWSLQLVTLTGLLAAVAFVGSLVLAYLSYVKLRTFCVICTLTYIVNVLLFLIII